MPTSRPEPLPYPQLPAGPASGLERYQLHSAATLVLLLRVAEEIRDEIREIRALVRPPEPPGKPTTITTEAAPARRTRRTG